MWDILLCESYISFHLFSTSAIAETFKVEILWIEEGCCLNSGHHSFTMKHTRVISYAAYKVLLFSLVSNCHKRMKGNKKTGALKIYSFYYGTFLYTVEKYIAFYAMKQVWNPITFVIQKSCDRSTFEQSGNPK